MSHEHLSSKTGIEKWPDRIYLQRDYECAKEGCGPHNDDDRETTWCKDKIHSTDVEYVRADLSRASAEPSAAPDYTAVYDAFGIGSAVRNPRTLLTNVENVLRRSRCLDAIEREFFMRIEKDEDGEEYEDCPLSWGSDPAGYIEQFREALAARAAEPSAARRAEYWKAEHLAGNAAIERLQQRVHELERELTAVRSSHDSLVAQRAAEPPTDRYGRREPPHGYAYRYHDYRGDVLRFNNGEEVNGGMPFEVVPYWIGAPVTKSATPSIDEQLAWDQRTYGTSYQRIDFDGTRTRIDPATVMIAPQPADETNGGRDV